MATPSVVQSGYTAGLTAASFATSPAVGNMLVYVIYDTDSTEPPTDNAGNTWTLRGDQADVHGNRVTVFTSTARATAVTLTMSMTGWRAGGYLIELDNNGGVDGTPVVFEWASAPDGTVTLPSITSSNLNGGTIIVAALDQFASTLTATAGYTQIYSAALSYDSVVIAAKSVTPGTYAPTFQSLDNANTGAAVAFIVGGTGLDKPSFTTQPTQQTKAVGQTATFTSAATNNGGTGMSYQWKLNGSNISGATGSSYTTPTIVVGDNGKIFEVVATDSLGSVKSGRAGLYLTGQGERGHGSCAGTSALTSGRSRRRSGLTPLSNGLSYGDSDSAESSIFGNFFFTSEPAVTSTLIAQAGVMSATGQPATVARSRTVVASPGSFAFSGQASIGTVGLSTGVGAYTVTGRPCTPAIARILTTEPASFSIAGVDATLGIPSGLYAATGVFNLAGVQSTPTRAIVFVAAPASITITGVTAGMPRGVQLSAASGTFVSSGQNAALVRDRQINGSTGTHSFVGVSAAMHRALALLTEQGGFTAVGNSISVGRNYMLNADDATMSLFGASSFRANDLVGVTQTGVFDIQGYPTTAGLVTNMIAEPAGIYAGGVAVTMGRTNALNALPEAFALSFSPVACLTGKSMSAAAGSFELTPSSPFLYFNKGLTALPSTHGISNFSVSGFKARKLIAVAGVAAITGFDASMSLVTPAISFTADTGAFALSGVDGAFVESANFNAAAGSFTVLGVASTAAITNRRLIAAAAAYSLTGRAVVASVGQSLGASPAAITITGSEASLVAVKGMGAFTGSMTIVTPAAALINSQVTSPILFADSTSHAITGMSITLVMGKTLGADTASFAISGTTVQSVTPKIRAVMKSKMGQRFVYLAPITSRGQAKSKIDKRITNFSLITTRGRVKSTMTTRRVLTSAILATT